MASVELTDLKDFTAGGQGNTWVHKIVINRSLKSFFDLVE